MTEEIQRQRTESERRPANREIGWALTNLSNIENDSMEDDSIPEDWTPEEERSYQEAKARGERRLAQGPLALSAEYDASHKALTIELSTGYKLLIPVHLLQGIPENATEAQLSDVHLLGRGGLRVEFTSLDAHFTLDGLIAGIYGSESWMAKLGRHGGLARTEAKARAARENGKRGGRPKRDSKK